MRNSFSVLFTVLGFFSLAVQGHSQGNKYSSQELTDKILNARKASDNAKLKYTWNSRIDVIREGKVMDILIQENRYGPDGTIQKKVINDQETAMPKSFLIHQIAEEEKQKMVTFLNGVHQYLEKYSLPDETMVIYFLNKAMISPPDPQGLIRMIGKNLLQAGDTLSWWLHDGTFYNNRTTVFTTFEKDTVNFSGSFASLPDGLNYMNFAEISIPSKNLIIQIQNYDFVKSE